MDRGWGECTAAADKYAKERNTIFVKSTTDNLPLNRAWHFKQAKLTTTGRNEGVGVGAAGDAKTTRQKEIIKINKREKKIQHDSKAKGNVLTERNERKYDEKKNQENEKKII